MLHMLRRDGTRGGGFCFFFGGCSGVGEGFFHTLGSGQTRMPPQSDGTPPCGGAGEGVFGLGDFFTCSGAAARGVRGGLRDCFTRSGALIRRRRAAGETRRGLMRVLFLRFCGGRCCGWIEGGCEREEECEAELRGTHSQAELGNDIGLMGALLPFVLRVVAGACVGRGSGQPRMPPRERQHEGLGGIGGFFCGWTGSRCGGMA